MGSLVKRPLLNCWHLLNFNLCDYDIDAENLPSTPPIFFVYNIIS